FQAEDGIRDFRVTGVQTCALPIFARQFLITGMIWAIVGGLMSVLFRLQLAYPDETFPILEDILGKWAKGGKITPEAYYALVTMRSEERRVGNEARWRRAAGD